MRSLGTSVYLLSISVGMYMAGALNMAIAAAAPQDPWLANNTLFGHYDWWVSGSALWRAAAGIPARTEYLGLLTSWIHSTLDLLPLLAAHYACDTHLIFMAACFSTFRPHQQSLPPLYLRLHICLAGTFSSMPAFWCWARLRTHSLHATTLRSQLCPRRVARGTPLMRTSSRQREPATAAAAA